MTTSQNKDETIVRLRVYSWGRSYELPTFQTKLNEKAKSWLVEQGLNIELLPPPQFGATGGSYTLATRVILYCIKIIPILRKIKDWYYLRAYDQSKSNFTILLENTGSRDKVTRDKKGIDLVISGYQLAKYLKEKFPIYEFSVTVSLNNSEDRRRSLISIDSSRMNDTSIGYTIRLLPKLKHEKDILAYLTYDRHFLVKLRSSRWGKEESSTYYYIPFIHGIPLF